MSSLSWAINWKITSFWVMNLWKLRGKSDLIFFCYSWPRRSGICKHSRLLAWYVKKYVLPSHNTVKTVFYYFMLWFYLAEYNRVVITVYIIIANTAIIKIFTSEKARALELSQVLQFWHCLFITTWYQPIACVKTLLNLTLLWKFSYKV